MIRRGTIACVALLLGSVAFAQERTLPATAPIAPSPTPATMPMSAEAPSSSPAPHAGERTHELTAEDVPDEELRPCHRWLVGAEYNVWRVKRPGAPPLVTTGRNTDPMAGSLSSPSTRIVFAGPIDLEERNGARFTLGRYLDDTESTRVEAIYAFAGDKRIGFTIGTLGSAPGFPVLARPFFNAGTNAEDASLVAFPGLATGFLDVRYNSFFESDEIVTLLAYLALAPHSADAKKPLVRDGRERAAAWLKKLTAADSTQAQALRLFRDVREGKPAKEVEPKIERLVSRQNKDGGWGQDKDLPSDAYATGQALYFLSLAGVKKDRPAIQRGVAFLVAAQKADGSWPMTSRAHPGAKPFTNPVPITYFGSAWATMALLRSGS